MEKPKGPPQPGGLELSKGDYPRARERTASPRAGNLAAKGGAPKPQSEDEEMLILISDDSSARPTYHPGVVIEEETGVLWIYVQFDVRSNGTFDVKLTQTTGNPRHDAIALMVLRRWVWEPRTVNGKPASSREIRRLRLNDQG